MEGEAVKEAARSLVLARGCLFLIKMIKTVEELPQADQTSVSNFINASLRECSTLQNRFSLTQIPRTPTLVIQSRSYCEPRGS